MQSKAIPRKTTHALQSMPVSVSLLHQYGQQDGSQYGERGKLSCYAIFTCFRCGLEIFDWRWGIFINANGGVRVVMILSRRSTCMHAHVHDV